MEDGERDEREFHRGEFTVLRVVHEDSELYPADMYTWSVSASYYISPYFAQQSNDLIKHLETAAFVAIDEEMTGIQMPGSGRPRKEIPPSVKYPELKQAPERYSIIQLGVSLFHANVPEEKADSSDEEGELEPSKEADKPKPETTWTVRTYNFYMFPAVNGNWDSSAREVVLNPAAVSFLNQHNMSFDLWTKQGVNYVTHDKAEEIVSEYVTKYEHQMQRQKDAQAPKSVQDTLRRRVELRRTDDINFFASVMASIREWLDNASGSSEAPSRLMLPACNSFLRRALYESIEREYPDLVLENGGGGQICVWRLSREEKLEREQRLKRDAWNNTILKVGMWRVFDALSRVCRGMCLPKQSPLFAPSFDDVDFDSFEAYDVPSSLGRRIPLVVHNGFMDVLFLLTHLHAPILPETLRECKELIASYFPVIYDTKVLATEHSTSWNNEQTNLSNLYQLVVTENRALSNGINIVKWDGEGDSLQEHEAAYDAFMTGSIYIGLLQHIARDHLQREIEPKPFVGDLVFLLEDSDSSLDLDCDQRNFFGRNKIFQMSMFTLDLQSFDEDCLKRGMIASASFHVSNFDPSVTTFDIVNCCSALRDASDRKVEFDIIWIDDTSLVVSAMCRPGGASVRPLTESERLVVLQEHGELIQRALRQRFASKEAIIKFDEYLHAQKIAKERENSWMNCLWKRLGTLLSGLSKRKAEQDVNPARKRRRFN